MRTRRGQAMMELAVGMFSLALVLCALFAFTDYIITSLELQRSLRAEAGCQALSTEGVFSSTASAKGSIEVRSLTADFIFGAEQVAIKESVSIPNMKLPCKE